MVSTALIAAQARIAEYLVACGVPELLAQNWAKQLLATAENPADLPPLLALAQQRAQAWQATVSQPLHLFPPAVPDEKPGEMPIQPILLRSMRHVPVALFKVLFLVGLRILQWLYYFARQLNKHKKHK